MNIYPAAHQTSLSKTVVLKHFGLWIDPSTILKLLKTLKTFCLYKLYLVNICLLEIKNGN